MELTVFRPSQLEEVQGVLREAFFREGSHPQYNEWEFARRLLSSQGYLPQLCLIAEMDGRVVGYNALTLAHIHGNPGLALGPLGVIPALQGQGIGSALVRESIRRAKEGNWPWIVLLGGSFYQRFGFEKAGEYGITVSENAFENDHLQIRFLEESARGQVSGKLRYCDAFYDGEGNLL